MNKNITIVYASHYGTTKFLAQAMATALEKEHCAVKIVPVDAQAAHAIKGPIIVLSAIIWDQPITPMRQWVQTYAKKYAQQCLAVGVICGSAGVRPEGGMSYAKKLAAKFGPHTQAFALTGKIPPKNEIGTVQWIALKAFAKAMRKPQLFNIEPDVTGAGHWAKKLLPTIGAWQEK